MVKHWREHDGVIHAEGANGDDRTLCGVILEGIEGEHEMTETFATINCSDCIGFITFCRKIRAGEFVSTARGAR